MCEEYNRNGLQSKLQHAERERDRHADAGNCERGRFCNLQKLVAKDSCALQQRMEHHWVQISQHVRALLTGLVLEVREDQSRDA